METTLIGRAEELAILHTALHSDEAELVAVFGRRRVGKTFLVTSAYRDKISFEITGVQDGSRQNQLQNFADQLEAFAKPGLPLKRPADWQEAFKLLREYLTRRIPETDGKTVVFLMNCRG